MFQLVDMKLFKLHFKMKYLELSKNHKIIISLSYSEVGWHVLNKLIYLFKITKNVNKKFKY